MNSLHYIGLLSGVVGIAGMFPYVRDIIFGKTRPERASFLIWSVLGLIAFFSQLSEGASTSLWMTGFSTLNCIIIFVLSIKKGRGGLTKRDIIFLIMAGFGLVLWYFSNRGLYALLLTIFVDSIGSYLTIHKTYLEPETENLTGWTCASIAGFLGVISVGRFNFILLMYPLYVFISSTVITGIIVFGRNKEISR